MSRAKLYLLTLILAISKADGPVGCCTAGALSTLLNPSPGVNLTNSTTNAQLKDQLQ